MNFRIFLLTLLVAGLTACAPHHPYTDETDTTSEPDGVNRTAPADTSPTLRQEGDRSQLDAYHWTLNRAVDSSGMTDKRWLEGPNEPVTLQFDEQRVSVSGLCNQLGANYRISGTKMQISDAHSTKRMCDSQALMQYEQSIAQRLPHVTSWAISDVEQSGGEPALTLRFDDNAQWVLTGTPTAANQYGSAGQTQFLEIAGQTVPCTDAQSSERQCLYARTVQYDASGVKQSYGDWQPLYNSIEGYQHNAGVRNVIRVKQYERQNPSPDASRQAYVFDQVVESETVGKGAPLPR